MRLFRVGFVDVRVEQGFLQRGLFGFQLGDVVGQALQLTGFIVTELVAAGGSGCGCSASVLAGHLLHGMLEGTWPRLLFAATGAMMSPTTNQQGESIPGICHAVALDMTKE